MEEILANDTLKIISNKDGYRFTTSMHKVVERLSNILEAWTSSGNNIPESDDEITLREIIIVERSEDAEFEHSIREMLNKGPVSVYFEYE